MRYQIVYHVTQDEYNTASIDARNHYISVSQWAKAKAFPSDVFKLMKAMPTKIASFPKGKKFEVKDCFLSQDWRKLPKGLRMSVGRQFFKQVEIEKTVPKVSWIKPKPTDKSNRTVYQKD
jgi:hypothetical protein